MARKMKDAKIGNLIKKEEKRQKEGIELIPSENYASKNVRQVLSSYFVNKYSEGYPGKRYYGGNENVDEVERLAQERAKKLFGVPYANIQPYSGSPANLAVYMATCQPGDTIMGQALTAGGHLTHGHKVSATGIFYKSVQYALKVESSPPKAGPPLEEKFKVQSDKERKLIGGARRGAPKKAQCNEHYLGLASDRIYQFSDDNDLFDYDEIRRLAKEYRPKLIWVGATAYPLKFHYDKFAEIADEINACLAADIAHVAGLIAAGVHPSPTPHVHIITTTTHKTLRGPRGAMIMVTEKGLKKDPELAEKINKAVFPGLQGGPHDNQTAAIASALYEASQPSFKRYAQQIVKNAKALAKILINGGLHLVGGGTENHLILVDLSSTSGPGAGIFAQKALDLVGLTLNKNTVPGEPSSPFYPSGIRLGTPAATTRGMKEKEMKFIGQTILKVLHLIKFYHLPSNKNTRGEYIKKFEKEMKGNKEIKKLRAEVKKLAVKFPIP